MAVALLCLSHTFVVSVRSPSLITHARRSFMFIDIWTLHNTANRLFVSCILSSSSCFYYLHLIIRAPRTFSRTPASSLSFRTRICIFSVSFPVTYRLTVHVRLPCTPASHMRRSAERTRKQSKRKKKSFSRHMHTIPSILRHTSEPSMLDRQRTQDAQHTGKNQIVY